MEKPLKVMWNGKLLREIYPHATWKQVMVYRIKKFFRKVFITAFIGGLLYLTFLSGGIFHPATIITTAEVIKEVEVQAPVLDRIADCESGQRDRNGKGIKGSARHYGKSGQVLMTGNENKSVDVGKYAINSVWFAKATELGLDITQEKDNAEMAKWIYKNRGTGDWSASASCWKQ